MGKFLTVLMSLCLMSVSAVAKADDYQSTINNFRQSAAAKPFFNNAYGYAVFPTIGKGGLGVGAAYGKGKVFKQGKAVGKTSMSQLSLGFQAGGQAYSQIVFFKDKRAFDEFTSGNFEFGAGASAVAITAAAQAQAGSTGVSSSVGTDADSTKQNKAIYRKGMAVMTLAKGGLMYEAPLQGKNMTISPLKSKNPSLR